MLQDTKESKAVTVANPGGVSTRQTFRSPSGMFQRKPHAPSPAEVQAQTAAKLTQVSPEKPKSDYELMVEAMTQLAQNPTEKTASAAVKAFEALTKAAGFAEKAAEHKQDLIVILANPNLTNSGEYVAPEQRDIGLRPNFDKADPLFLQGQFITDPAPSAPAPPRPEPKAKSIQDLTQEYRDAGL
jgi:hypothetical protein